MTLSKLNRDFESAHRRYHALPERSRSRERFARTMRDLKLRQLEIEQSHPLDASPGATSIMTAILKELIHPHTIAEVLSVLAFLAMLWVWAALFSAPV